MSEGLSRIDLGRRRRGATSADVVGPERARSFTDEMTARDKRAAEIRRALARGATFADATAEVRRRHAEESSLESADESS